MLRLEGVSSGYGNISILQNVSLDVLKGEVVAIIGANGAGKSTMLKTISALLPCRAGRILVEGDDITRWEAERVVARGVVQVPEGRQLFGAFTVAENLRIGTYISRKRLTRRELHTREQFALDLFPVIRQRLKQRAGTLSGGEQQMVAIARALMADPKLLLLDEPSLGLSPVACDIVFETLAKLNQEGITIVLVEQDADRALSVATRGYVMSLGRIILEAGAEALRQDPTVKEIYLGELAVEIQ